MTVRPSLLVLAAPLAALSCSDPPPTPPRGSVEIRLSPPAQSVPGIGTRTSCMAGTSGTYTYFLGKAGLAGMGLPKVKAGLLEHGHGINVSCTVKAIGGGRFSVNASLSGVDSNTRRVATSFTLNATLSATAAPADNPGQVAFFSPDTTHLRTLSDLPPCKIGPITPDGIVKEGALLVPFSCDALADSSDTIKGCAASGFIAIERCRTGQEED